MSILTGPAILEAVDTGRIAIEPFDPKQLNPASYDLRLGDHVKRYNLEQLPFSSHYGLDTQKNNGTTSSVLAEDGTVLVPGVLYLMHTIERVCARQHVAVIDGKSSLGRLGVFVHATAGYVDPGFNGQYTLEVTVVHPVVLYPGMRIAQVRFQTLAGDIWDYQQMGHYTGKASMGPVPSMSYKQFEDDK